MARRNIVDRLREGEILILDGATGSELQRREVNVDKGSTKGHLGVWSAAANLDAPDVVRQIHEDYLAAGADIVTSNNFYTTPTKLAMIGEGGRWEEYTRRGGELAVQARDAVKPDGLVAGGIAPPFKCDLRKEFADQARVLASAGVDFMLPEYMGGDVVVDDPLSDCVAAVDACASSGLPVFLGLSRLTEQGTILDGTSFTRLVEALQGHDVDGIFLMCSYPHEISACLPRLRDVYQGPIGAYAHLEYNYNPKFGTSSDETFFTVSAGQWTPKRYAEIARSWKEMGVQVIGGCCATGPEHIRELAPLVKSSAS